MSEILPNSQNKKIGFSVLYTGRHETTEPETKCDILLTVLAVARVSAFSEMSKWHCKDEQKMAIHKAVTITGVKL